ncbi:putative C9orf72-like protein family protein [Blattamonas nauphoetae]|uniref:C9orf72-like protein family protein n=1 Tax=Blattamonas nauphoetae TaxID=2049346 RepID=A0ABQ9XFA0_9EUKA|nr:putative C9orf72-like protein family protein [Blattamonas nauphoetae]
MVKGKLSQFLDSVRPFRGLHYLHGMLFSSWDQLTRGEIIKIWEGDISIPPSIQDFIVNSAYNSDNPTPPPEDQHIVHTHFLDPVGYVVISVLFSSQKRKKAAPHSLSLILPGIYLSRIMEVSSILEYHLVHLSKRLQNLRKTSLESSLMYFGTILTWKSLEMESILLSGLLLPQIQDTLLYPATAELDNSDSFLQRSITAHLQNNCHTIVVGSDHIEVNRFINTLLHFSPNDHIKTARYAHKYSITQNDRELLLDTEKLVTGVMKVERPVPDIDEDQSPQPVLMLAKSSLAANEIAEDSESRGGEDLSQIESQVECSPFSSSSPVPSEDGVPAPSPSPTRQGSPPVPPPPLDVLPPSLSPAPTLPPPATRSPSEPRPLPTVQDWVHRHFASFPLHKFSQFMPLDLPDPVPRATIASIWSTRPPPFNHSAINVEDIRFRHMKKMFCGPQQNLKGYSAEEEIDWISDSVGDYSFLFSPEYELPATNWMSFTQITSVLSSISALAGFVPGLSIQGLIKSNAPCTNALYFLSPFPVTVMDIDDESILQVVSSDVFRTVQDGLLATLFRVDEVRAQDMLTRLLDGRRVEFDYVFEPSSCSSHINFQNSKYLLSLFVHLLDTSPLMSAFITAPAVTAAMHHVLQAPSADARLMQVSHEMNLLFLKSFEVVAIAKSILAQNRGDQTQHDSKTSVSKRQLGSQILKVMNLDSNDLELLAVLADRYYPNFSSTVAFDSGIRKDFLQRLIEFET